MHIATTRGQPAMIAWLIERRADVLAADAEGFSALTWACIKGDEPSMQELLKGRADPARGTESSGKLPLALCAERGHVQCVEALLRARALPEAVNRDGTNPLMCAAHRGETEVASLLLGRGCSVNAVDSGGWSALMYACNAPVPMGGELAEKKVHVDGSPGMKSTCELLCVFQADVNAQAVDGVSALMVGAGRCRALAVKRLLEYKAQVNLRSVRMQSALLVASSMGTQDAVRALIGAAAELNVQNQRGESALSLAENQQVAQLLMKAGAVPPKAKGKKGKKKG